MFSLRVHCLQGGGLRKENPRNDVYLGRGYIYVREESIKDYVKAAPHKSVAVFNHPRSDDQILHLFKCDISAPHYEAAPIAYRRIAKIGGNA